MNYSELVDGDQFFKKAAMDAAREDKAMKLHMYQKIDKSNYIGWWGIVQNPYLKSTDPQKGSYWLDIYDQTGKYDHGTWYDEKLLEKHYTPMVDNLIDAFEPKNKQENLKL